MKSLLEGIISVRLKKYHLYHLGIERQIYLLKLKKVQCVLCGFVSGQNIDKLIEFFPIHNNAVLYFEMYK